MSNPFSDLAKESVSYVRRRQLDKQKLVPKTPEEKRQLEQDILHAKWLVEFDKQKQALLKGPYGGSARTLCAMLEKLTIDDGDRLIEMARVWQSTSVDVRYLVLQLIDSALIELRERHGMSPIDDALPSENDNAFLIIRRLLT